MESVPCLGKGMTVADCRMFDEQPVSMATMVSPAVQSPAHHVPKLDWECEFWQNLPPWWRTSPIPIMISRALVPL